MGIKKMIRDWFEWLDAKHWAKQYHPAWVELATNKRVSDYTREIYREKILLAYRGYEYV